MSAKRTLFVTGYLAHSHAKERRRSPFASEIRAQRYADAAAKARALDPMLFDAFTAQDLHSLRWNEIADAVKGIAS